MATSRQAVPIPRSSVPNRCIVTTPPVVKQCIALAQSRARGRHVQAREAACGKSVRVCVSDYELDPGVWLEAIQRLTISCDAGARSVQRKSDSNQTVPGRDSRALAGRLLPLISSPRVEAR